MTTSEIRELIDRFWRAWERQDVDGLVSCYTDDCTVESPIFGLIQGSANLRASYDNLFQSFSDPLMDLEDIIVDRDDQRAVLLGRLTSTNRRPFLGVPITGQRLEMTIAYGFRFRDGLILSESRHYTLGGLRESLERARIELELKVASQVQQALLSRTCHAGPHFEALGASRTCRAIGGDFFEYVDLPSGAFGVALCDVSGKGPAAALLASMLQGILSVEAAWGPGPSATLERMNRRLVRRGLDGRFATLVYGVLSPDGRFAYSNAGHNPPLVLSSGEVQRLDVGGSILGVFEDATFQEQSVYLQPGDTVVMYTDGVTEALNLDGDEFGETRLTSLVRNGSRSPSAMVDQVLGGVEDFSQGMTQTDDITVVVIRFQ